MPIQSCGQSVSARRGKRYTEIGPLKANLKAVYHISASSAETKRGQHSDSLASTCNARLTEAGGSEDQDVRLTLQVHDGVPEVGCQGGGSLRISSRTDIGACLTVRVNAHTDALEKKQSNRHQSMTSLQGECSYAHTDARTYFVDSMSAEYRVLVLDRPPARVCS
jgi:hypothetical protein